MRSILSVLLICAILSLALEVVAAYSEEIGGLPVNAFPIGSPINVSNDFYEVYVESNTFVHFKDFQRVLFVWVNVTNKGNTSDKISIESDTEPLSVVDWQNMAAGSHISEMTPGTTDPCKIFSHATHAGTRPQEKQYNFSFTVSSEQHPEANQSFNLTVIVPPELNSSQDVQIQGEVSDASTGDPIEGAYVNMFLGSYEYGRRESSSMGSYSLTVAGVDALNELYSSYNLTVPGYRLVAQKEGYETFVYEYLQPNSTGGLVFNVSLTPLAEQVNYELIWEVNLSTPGVWEIAVDDNWTRFAVAMGKHPDDGDADQFPTKIPFIHVNGSVLWNKSVTDESWSIDMNGDGSRVACAIMGNDSAYYFWDSEGNEVWNITLSLGGNSHELSLSHDGQYMATGPSAGGATFTVINTSSGSELWDYTMPPSLRATAFTPDDQYVIMGGSYELHLFHINGTKVWYRFIAALPYLIDVASDGSRFMVPNKGDSIVVYALNGTRLWRHDQYVVTYGAMSDDGSVAAILSHDGNVYCYNATGDLQWYVTVPGESGAGHNGIDITPDGSYIVVGGGRYNTLLYDSQGNMLWRHEGNGSSGSHPYKYSVMSVRVSPNASKIAAGYGYSNPKLLYFERVNATTTTTTSTTSTTGTTGTTVTSTTSSVTSTTATVTSTSVTGTTTSSSTTTTLIYSTVVNASTGETVQVNASNMNVSLDVNVNSSVSNAGLQLTYYSDSPSSANLTVPSLGKYIDVNASSTLEDSVAWALLKIYYTHDELFASNLNESTLKLYWLNEGVKEWQEIGMGMDWVHGTGVDATENFVWANMSQFNVYAVGGETLGTTTSTTTTSSTTSITSASTTTSTSLTQQDIELQSGWNLVSLPLAGALIAYTVEHPGFTAVTIVLSLLIVQLLYTRYLKR